jgi:hypothetical protein
MLSTCWRDWAARLSELDGAAWFLPTRCGDWTVHHLAAHVAPDPSVLARLESVASSAPAEVDDAAHLLRRFNQPGGIAHELASAVAEHARLTAALRQKDNSSSGPSRAPPTSTVQNSTSPPACPTRSSAP